MLLAATRCTHFLVAENRWEDKLTILQKNEQMASRAGDTINIGGEAVLRLYAIRQEAIGDVRSALRFNLSGRVSSFSSQFFVLCLCVSLSLPSARVLVRGPSACVRGDTLSAEAHGEKIFHLHKHRLIIHIPLAAQLIGTGQTGGVSTRRYQGDSQMELIFTTIAVIGGMALSLSVALLVEEVIFGKVLGLFFVPRTSEVKTEQ